MIAFDCPKCSRRLGVVDKAKGDRTQCPACGQFMRIPSRTGRSLLLAAGLVLVAGGIVFAAFLFSPSGPYPKPPSGNIPTTEVVQNLASVPTEAKTEPGGTVQDTRSTSKTELQ